MSLCTCGMAGEQVSNTVQNKINYVIDYEKKLFSVEVEDPGEPGTYGFVSATSRGGGATEDPAFLRSSRGREAPA